MEKIAVGGGLPKDLISLEEKPIVNLKLVTPISGIISFKDKNTIRITNNNTEIDLKISDILKPYKNGRIKFLPTVKNYQFVDQ